MVETCWQVEMILPLKQKGQLLNETQGSLHCAGHVYGH